VLLVRCGLEIYL